MKLKMKMKKGRRFLGDERAGIVMDEDTYI